MSRSTMLRFTSAACAALLSLSCSACGEPNAADSSTTMRVAYLSTANYLTTVRGEDFLDETMQHTNVKFTGPYNPTDAYSAVLSGNADATSTAPARTSTSWRKANRGWPSRSSITPVIRKESWPRRNLG